VKRRQAAHNNVAPVRRLLAIVALGGVFGLLATPASAAGLSPPVADCQLHGHLTQTYTAAQLRNGLSTMPAYIREYSGCYNVLQQALLEKIHHLSGGNASGAGSFLPTWLIVVLAILVLGGAAFGIVALRGRGGGRGDD
jgi:hypothetical protein